MATRDSHQQSIAAYTAAHCTAFLILVTTTVFVFRDFFFNATFREWLPGLANQVLAWWAFHDFPGWFSALIYIAAGCDQ